MRYFLDEIRPIAKNGGPRAARYYTVRAGDNPYKIAQQENVPLEDILRLNPGSEKVIYAGQKLQLTPNYQHKSINIKDEWKREAQIAKQQSNLAAIQGAYHSQNYVVLDKKNRLLTVYDKNNIPVYQTNNIATGASGNDYNTKTYTTDDKKLKDGEGNMSTPAGITVISGIGSYHGYPAFTRARVHNDGKITLKNGKNDDIASSFHFGNIGKEKYASNGCVRIAGKNLEELTQFIAPGTHVYTLPDKEGSRFTLKGGKLNFTADQPYGNEDVNNPKRDWDDYNVTIDKRYEPLTIKFQNDKENSDYNLYRQAYSKGIVNNKKQLQKEFNLSSDEYNHLAYLALGLAEQETQFGTSKRYVIKQIPGAELFLQHVAKPIRKSIKQNPYKLASYAMPITGLASTLVDIVSNQDVNAPSKGLTQIKYADDVFNNKELRTLYSKYGIDSSSITDPYNSALATMLRLANIYNNEVKAGRFYDRQGYPIDPYDALLYKWNGHNVKLKSGTANPTTNSYLNQVKKYANRFGLSTTRTIEI